MLALTLAARAFRSVWWTKAARFCAKGGIVTRTDIPFDMQVKAMADCVLETIDKGGYTLGDVKAIGAGVPGVTDPRTGNIAFCTNLGWVDVPFVQEFNKLHCQARFSSAMTRRSRGWRRASRA